MDPSSNSQNSNANVPIDTIKQSPPNKTKQTNQSNVPEGYVKPQTNPQPQLASPLYNSHISQRIPVAVQIGAVSTLSDVMSGKSTFEPQHTMNKPTPKELLEFVRDKMDKTGPSESGPIHKTTPAPAIGLPNTGYPEGTCAGCGAEDGEGGGALRQCARCKGRKYCGRACQKLDWPGHQSGCVEV